MSAVIVVDIQNDYFEGGAFPLFNAEAAAQNAAKVIAKAREQKATIFTIQHISADPAKIPFFLPDTTGAEVYALVKPLESDPPVIKKFYPNSFVQTNLKEQLDALNVKDVTIIGSMSQMCITSTTRAAAELGYNVTVVEDACACPQQEFKGVVASPQQVHAVAMSGLAFGFAKIVTTEEYLA